MGDKDQNVKKEEDEPQPKQSLNKVLSNNSQGKIKTKSEQNNAGPSNETTTTTNAALPNAIPYKTNLNDGYFVSQLSLKHVFTKEELASALKCTSLTIEVSNMEKATIEDGKFNITLADVKKHVSSMKFSENQHTSVLETKAMTKGESPGIISCDSNVPRNNLSNDVVPMDGQNASLIVPPANIIPITVVPPDAKINNNNKKKDFALISRDSLSSIGSNVCRICMTRGKERLISPCNCKGSLASVHLSCLERWLNQVGRNHCELCGYSYPAIRTPRYTVLQALRLWFGNPRNRNHLQSDCLIFWLLSTVTAGLLAVCFVGTQYFVIEGNKIGKLSGRKQEGVSHRITETAMNFFMIIVICGYSVTVYLLWKDHFVLWNRWRRANVNVRLLLSPDASPVPFVPRDNNYSLLV